MNDTMTYYDEEKKILHEQIKLLAEKTKNCEPEEIPVYSALLLKYLEYSLRR